MTEPTPGSWEWQDVYGIPILVKREPHPGYRLVIYVVSDDASSEAMKLLQPDHPIAELIRSAPALHTELHRLRAERAELLAALEGLMDGDYLDAVRIASDPGYGWGGVDTRNEALRVVKKYQDAATTAIANAKSAEAAP